MSDVKVHCGILHVSDAIYFFVFLLDPLAASPTKRTAPGHNMGT